MKWYSESQVKELLGQQRAICQIDFEKGSNNVLFSETPKLKNSKKGKVYSPEEIQKAKSKSWQSGFGYGFF